MIVILTYENLNVFIPMQSDYQNIRYINWAVNTHRSLVVKHSITNDLVLVFHCVLLVSFAAFPFSFFHQVFNEINSREIEKINIFRGMFDSKIFFTVILSTVAFQVIIVEFLGTFASTVPLSWQLWLLSVLIGAVSMPIAAILKCIPVENEATKHHDGYEALPSGPEQA